MTAVENAGSASLQTLRPKTQETGSLESEDKVYLTLIFLGAGCILGKEFYDEHLKDHLSKGYQEYRRQEEGPTTVWRWLGKGVMKRVDAMKNWDPH